MAQMMHKVFQIKYILIKSTCSQLSVSEEEEVKTLEYIGIHENTLEHCGLPVTKVLK
jgi:hypothetical protein